MSTCPFISSREFNSQTSELRTNVHGQSCHLVNQRGSKSSSQVGTVDDSNIPGSWKFVKNMGGRESLCFYRYDGFLCIYLVPFPFLFPLSVLKGSQPSLEGLETSLNPV